MKKFLDILAKVIIVLIGIVAIIGGTIMIFQIIVAGGSLFLLGPAAIAILGCWAVDRVM